MVERRTVKVTKYLLSIDTYEDTVPVAQFSDFVNIDFIRKIGQSIVERNPNCVGYYIFDYETKDGKNND